MSIALPSKKIQALIIVVIGIFLAYLVFVSNVGSAFKTATSDSRSLEAAAVKAIPSDLDSDRDGLKDWQEPLWGTDGKNADSDGDGTKDGDEIEKGRDPGVAGPDDDLSKTRGISEASVNTFSQTIGADPDNISQSVSRDLFAKFMSLQSTGNLDETAQADVVASVIADINPGSIPPRYSISDVVVTDTSKASLKAYGNAVAQSLVTLQGSVGPNTSNEKALSLYATTIDTLKNTKAPSSVGLSHLQVLNNFNASYQMLVLLAEYEKDPIKGLVALKSLQTNIQNGTELFKTIASEFQNNDIIFDKIEAGYIWNNYL